MESKEKPAPAPDFEMTDSSGSFTFNKGTSLAGPYLTAIAIDANGNTSGFSIATLRPTTPATAGKIVFVSDRDGNLEIYLMDADGSNWTRLTDNPAGDWPGDWWP